MMREPPPRPSARRERLASLLFRSLAPRLPRPRPVALPITPYEQWEIPRPFAPTPLAGTFFPAGPDARGAVLLAHPWIQWGRAYFFRQGRLEALHDTGYHCLVFDFGGLGESGPASPTFPDRDVEAALAALRRRVGDLPLYLWGVSAGGCWSHALLSRSDAVEGALFEDVSIHLLEWSKRKQPRGWPFYLVLQHLFPDAYRFLDQRRHAPALRPGSIAYVGGERDGAVLAEETRDLAERAGARCLIVERAGHLGSIRADYEGVVAMALETFRKARGPASDHQAPRGC